MARSDPPAWPAYPLGPPAHIHALGVIAINYNSLEHALFVLLREYLGVFPALHGHIFQSLTVGSVLELFKLAVQEHEKHDTLRQRLMEFCPPFVICYANRNILMHSNVREADATEICWRWPSATRANRMSLWTCSSRYQNYRRWRMMPTHFSTTHPTCGSSSCIAAGRFLAFQRQSKHFHSPHCPIHLLRQ